MLTVCIQELDIGLPKTAMLRSHDAEIIDDTAFDLDHRRGAVSIGAADGRAAGMEVIGRGVGAAPDTAQINTAADARQLIRVHAPSDQALLPARIMQHVPDRRIEGLGQ
ncbi:hypothetical protein D3C72_377100 [compost metagenome]